MNSLLLYSIYKNLWMHVVYGIHKRYRPNIWDFTEQQQESRCLLEELQKHQPLPHLPVGQLADRIVALAKLGLEVTNNALANRAKQRRSV